MAGTGLDQVFLSQSFAGDIVSLVVIASLPVIGGESTDVVDNVHENSGTQLPQAGTGNGVGLQNIHSVFGCHPQGIKVCNVVQFFAGCLDHDGFQLLAAHDSTDTGTTGGTVLIVHNGGKQHLLLTGGSDVQNGNVSTVLCLELLVNGFAHDTYIFPGIQQLNLIVVNVDVGPVGSFTFHNDGIPTGVLQLGTPDTAGVGAGNHAGKGGLCADHVAACGRGGSAGHRTGYVDQLVFRGQGIDGGNALVIEHLGAKTTAANELVGKFQIQRFHFDLAGGQIDAGNFFVVCASHMQYLHKKLKLSLQFVYVLYMFIIVEITGVSRADVHFCVKPHETVSFYAKRF